MDEQEQRELVELLGAFMVWTFGATLHIKALESIVLSELGVDGKEVVKKAEELRAATPIALPQEGGLRAWKELLESLTLRSEGKSGDS